MPMGTMVRQYNRGVRGNFLRESSSEVVRASICVAAVAKTRCQQVKRIAMLSISREVAKYDARALGTQTHEKLGGRR